MNKKLLSAAGLLTAGLLAGGIASAASAANAADDTLSAATNSSNAAATTDPSTPDTTNPPTFGGDHDGDGVRGGHGAEFNPGGAEPVRDDEKAVDAATASKLTDLALAEVPGATVIRVETDADGAAYEAHLRKADGTLVTVKFDESFAVLEVQDGMGKGPHGAVPNGKAKGHVDGMGHGRHGAPGQDKKGQTDSSADESNSTN